MDPNADVLEISSDEEVVWDVGDDHNWIAELLDEVNRDDCGYDDGGDDSDEVILVSEVLPSKKPRKKSTSKSSSSIELDDDCVVLDYDPNKPTEVRKDEPVNGDEDDDSDDLLVVSEKGQVACRDYPHPRHLCIKFPFFSTPNESHCNQCYCYVCDSLAPCLYWGHGSASLDHCRATDKDEFWKLKRQSFKNESKRVQPVNRFPPLTLVPPASALVQTSSNQVTRPSPIRVCSISSNFGVPNIINHNRSPISLSRNNYQPGLVSQQLIRGNCTDPRDRGHRNCNLATPIHVPVFKRTGSAAVPATANRYNSRKPDYRGNEMHSRSNKYSGSLQPNIVNTSHSFSPSNLTSSNSLLEEPPPFGPRLISNSYVESPIVFPPHPVTLSSQTQGQSSVPNYCAPSETPVDIPSIYNQNVSHHGNHAQRPNIDPKFFQDISWPQTQTNHQTAVLEGTGLANGSSLATGEPLVDYEYDNWIFNNEPCEAGSMGISGSFGLNEFSTEPAFVDPGTIFDF